MAIRFGADADAAETAGWLHDVSAVIPNERRVELAEQLGLDVLPEERALPMITHQRLSRVFARELFGVTAEPVLSAIGCHTTLKAPSSQLDRIVFVADKIAWDQPGRPPYYDDIVAAACRSIDDGARCYLSYLWQRREMLAVVHPWFVAAYQDLAENNRGYF
jgi:predicted HD superfamily hydrolase involved in NAD metabolism